MDFRYWARDEYGKMRVSTTAADSAAALIGRLKGEGLVPLRIQRLRAASSKKRLLRSRVKGKEVAVFTRQLATILDSGVLLTEGLNTLAEDLENEYFSGIIKKTAADINAGSSFSKALQRFPRIFPPVYVALVKSGEEVGNLAHTLADLAKYLETYEAMKEKVQAATRYPLFVMGVMTVIVSIIVLFIIPRFAALFANAGAQLPWLTRVIVGISNFFLSNILRGALLIAGVVFLCRYLLKQFKVRFTVDYYQVRIPGLRHIILRVILARFSRTLSTLLAGGVTIMTSLSVANETTKNLYLKQIFEEIKDDVLGGTPLNEAMTPHEEIPRMLVKMVAVGEKSGRLDDMLRRTADYYEDELTITFNKLSSLIEPIMIVIIGAVVLVVALALYLPIFQLSMAIR